MEKNSSKSKIIPPAMLENWVNMERKKLDKLVFTNGCFDIIHKGHIIYLEKAAKLGSHLIVGINSDISVKRLKGKNRPYQDESSRTLIMAAFQFVDFVITFNEDTPENIINKIIPDVLVKGGDYNIEDIVGYETVKNSGGTIKTIDFVEGYSSTKVINKL